MNRSQPPITRTPVFIRLGLVLFGFLLATPSSVVAQQTDSLPRAITTGQGLPAPASKVGTPVVAAPVAKAGKAGVRPLSVTVELVDAKTKLIGTLTGETSMGMKTSFGTVDVPLSEVAGFRFPSKSDASTTVVMLNGDSITGATDLKVLTVETEWGTAQINGQSIQSILFVPNLAWKSIQGLNGNRWTLSEPPATSALRPSGVRTLNPIPQVQMRLPNTNGR
ncbi:MAG: hypothetical protein AAF802_10910 [Planctomycetota bacterium]